MEQNQNGLIAMSTGVKFSAVNVPVMAFEAAKQQLARERPKVPVIYLTDKDRAEPNANDPDYMAAMDEWESRLNERLVDIAIMLGLEIAEIPEGKEKPESPAWSRKHELLGLVVASPDKPEERFLAWVKLYAAPTLGDMAAVLNACARNAGVTEEDAAQAADLFRSKTKRAAGRASSS